MGLSFDFSKALAKIWVIFLELKFYEACKCNFLHDIRELSSSEHITSGYVENCVSGTDFVAGLICGCVSHFITLF